MCSKTDRNRNNSEHPNCALCSPAEVASVVAQGDMSRSITVETQGEVAELKTTST